MNDSIATQLRLYRIINDITQEKMAEDLHISRSKISSWETCRRDMSMTDAIIISDYFNASMDNLYNQKNLNSEEFRKIAKRYFENEEISVEEKNIVLKDLYEYRTRGEIKELFNESKWLIFNIEVCFYRRIMSVFVSILIL